MVDGVARTLPDHADVLRPAAESTAPTAPTDRTPLDAATPPDAATPRAGRVRRLTRRRGGRLVWLGGLLLALACLVSAATVDSDTGRDLLSLSARVGGDLVHLRWQFTLVVVLCGAAHYLATAVAARAAATVPLGWRELTMAQLAAAAANRLTPAGLGGAALNVRYFHRRGMPVAGAVGAVAALTLFGGVADLLVGVLVVAAGSAVGLGGGASEFARLQSYAMHLLGPVRSPWLWLVVLALVLIGLALFAWRKRQALASRVVMSVRRAVVPVRELGRRPARLAQLLAASGATTLILGLAFVASAWMLPGVHPSDAPGALLIGFMLGAAGAAAVPVPAGLGSTEAALVAVLTAAHVPLGQAVEQVLIFRLITFWLPAVIGLPCARRLHRVGAV